MDDALLLGIDVGTTNCKALLFSLNGRPLGTGSVPTPTRRPRPNWAEFDPEELWQAVAAAIRQAIASVDPRRIQGVAVASMGEAGALLDAAGHPTCPIIAWYDSRTIPQQRWWLDQVGAARSFVITGLHPEPIYSAYKLMWLHEHMAEAYATAVRWLNVADYIAFRLCGAQTTDYSLASRTMLFDLRHRRWSDELVEWAGIRRDLLPELVPSGVRLGEVHAAAAAATGLVVGTPVASGGHDHVCGAFAAGVNQVGTCLDSMGTAEAAFLPLEALRLDERLAQTACAFGAHVARDKYYAMGGVHTSGAAVEWAAKLLAWPEPVGGDAYERMAATAAQVPPGSLGVFFIPRLAAGDHGAFVGLTAGAGAAALGRAVYEGLAYEWRRYLETFEAVLQLRATTVKVIGGGARTALWVQIKADVLNRPLHVLEAAESVALGAALLAGIGAGVYRDEEDALARLHHAGRVVAPDAGRAAFYERCYRDVYLRIAPALADIHAAIAALPLADQPGATVPL